MEEFKPTFLMIKRHSKTNLKYFCKTTGKDPIKYLGSGDYWKSHIRIHGREFVETDWFKLFENKQELIEYALFFSEQFDIVNSKEWANLKIENGLDGNPPNIKFSEDSNRKRSKTLTGYKRSISEINKSKEKRRKIYICIDPENNKHVTKNLKQFCIDNNLKYTSMNAVSLNKRNHHKQWKCTLYDN